MTKLNKKLTDTFFKKIKLSNSIVIFGHKSPDGDCVGSILGLKKALKFFYQDKTILSVGSIPEYLPSFIEKHDDVSLDTIKNSLCIVLDVSELDRVEDQRIKDVDHNNIICVDHHISKGELPFLVVRDTEAISATLILTEMLLYKFKKIPTLDCATYLYLGLVTDSGRFQFDSSCRTLDIASKLISCGVNAKALYNQLYIQTTLDLKYRSLIFSQFKTDKNVTYCVMKKEMYESIGLSQDDASGKVNQLSLVDGRPIWAFFTEQNDGTIRCELRSNSEYNVQKVALMFKGGGHLAASGCTLKSFDEVTSVVNELNKLEKVELK